MIDTAIYISITRGNEAVVLEGNLYLFRELLATLNEAARESPQAESAPIDTLVAEDLNSDQGE